MDSAPSADAERKTGFPRLELFYILAICAIAFIGLTISLKDPGFAIANDEGYYLSYAEVVHQNGLSGFRDSFDLYVSDSRHWIYPNPLRVGYFAVAALWIKIFGVSLVPLAYLSAVCHIGFILAVGIFSYRWFGRARCLMITALIATSPLCLALARRALADSMATFMLALTTGLFIERIRNPASRAVTIAFPIVFALTILVKEHTAFFLVPVLFYTVYDWLMTRRLPTFSSVFVMFGAPLIVVGTIWLIAAGGVTPLLELFSMLLEAQTTNVYTTDYGSGPWYRYLIDFLVLSPWTTLFGLAYGVIIIEKIKRRDAGAAEVFLLFLFAGLVFVLSFLTKNARFVIIFEFPLRVFAVLMLFGDAYVPMR